VPRAGRVVHSRRSVGILVLRHVEVRRIGPVGLFEIGVRSVDLLGQIVDPHLSFADLAVGERCDELA